MGRNVVISLLLHVAIIAAAYFGLPSFNDHADVTDVPISVEIVNVTDVTNIPTKPKPSKAEPKKAAPPPKPPAPPPGPKGSVEQPPAPKPVPEAPEDKVALVVQPEQKPKKEAKPKPEPKDEPKKTSAKKRQPAPLPPRKPKPPDEFASVLKTLEEIKSAPPPQKETDKAEPDFARMMAEALETDKQRTDIGPDITISEIDLVRQQIKRCWNLPAGAKGAHEMQISIQAQMNPDGTVRTARILDSARMGSDPFYRTMAESALRAVLNPACQPFKLPPEKYARWMNLKLIFDPKEMFGL